MPDLLHEVLAHQFEASLGALNVVIARCPDAIWHEPVANWKFCQAAFHTVFFTDVYLQPSEDPVALKAQAFHQSHQAQFRDYEELEDRPQVHTYDKSFVREYLLFVRQKAQDTIARESAQVLAGQSGFSWRKCSRAELHVYSIRHIQHHAAQLGLRLRQHSPDITIPWVSHAWVEA